jgi:hypothetical protein
MEDKKMLDFYFKNLESLDDAWYNHCFMQGRYPNPKESARQYRSHNAFWHFVEQKFKEKTHAAA